MLVFDVQFKINGASDNHVTILYDSTKGAFTQFGDMMRVRDSIFKVNMDMRKYKFYAKIVSVDGCTATTDTIPLSFYIGINRLNNLNISIFPNPAKNTITIRNPDLNVGQVSIYNTIGNLMFHQNVSKNQAEMVVDLTTIPDGLYWIQISTKTGVAGKYLLKQN